MRAKAVQAGAQEWLDTLPALIDDLTTRWQLTPGKALGDGTEAYVVTVTRADGVPAVLKLVVPRPGDPARHEIAVLRRAGGAGCARLLRADESRGALLIERLGPSMADLALPQPERLDILCDLAQRVWAGYDDGAAGVAGSERTVGAADSGRTVGVAGSERTVGAVDRGRPGGTADNERPGGTADNERPGGTADNERPGGAADSESVPTPGLPTGAEKAASLSGYIRRGWLELGRPCSEAAVDQAVAAAESRQRAHDPARAVLVHGDIHQWNALRERAGDGFKLVDPDGLWAEPECDLGVLMREDPVELMAADPWDRAHRLAARTGTDPRAIWEWGLAERVSTGLVLTAVGLKPVAADMLAAADQIARL